MHVDVSAKAAELPSKWRFLKFEKKLTKKKDEIFLLNEISNIRPKCGHTLKEVLQSPCVFICDHSFFSINLKTQRSGFLSQFLWVILESEQHYSIIINRKIAACDFKNIKYWLIIKALKE